MDLENDVKLRQYLEQVADGDAKKANILPLYVSQSKKMNKLIKEMTHFQTMVEEHNKIILKHQEFLKECLTLGAYNTKNQIFQQEMEDKVQDSLNQFDLKLSQEMRLKVDEDVFSRKLNDKAGANDVGSIYLDVNRIKIDINRIQESLEKKADDSIKIPAATEEELQNLQVKKADKSEIDSLRQEIERLENIVRNIEDEFSEGDSYDEYDDEDSQVEDVISLAEGLSNEKEDEEDDDEEFFDAEDDPAKKLADKAKELTNRNLIGGTGFEPIKKIGELEEKGDKLKQEMDKEIKEEAKKVAQRKNTDLNQDMQETLKKMDAEEKKSNPSTNAVD